MDQQLTRRRLLGTAAAAGGAAGLSLFPASFRRALAATPERSGSLSEVRHVLFLMQENRTFDQYFGSLSGVAGFDDPDALRLPNGNPVWFQPDPANPDGYVLPFHLDTTRTNEALGVGLDNGWPATHASWDNGLMDNFVPGEAGAGASAPLTMGYYTRGDIPFYYSLADAFTVCDHFHVSVLGPSLPNHTYAVSGTIDPAGVGGGPVLTNSASSLFQWTTFYERLEAAGVTWRDYVQQPPAGPELASFAQFANAPKSSPLYQNGMVARPYPAVLDDIRHDRLPQFSRIRGQFPPETDEHPGQSLPGLGAEFLYDVLDAFGQNPDVWARSVLFIAYDDAGGLFDHVAPPTPPPGTPGEFLTVSPLPDAAGGFAGPVGLGLRCAALVVSPFSTGGWVASETFDFASIIKFCERLFGVFEPNLSAWRRSAVGDLTSALRLSRASLTIPALRDPQTNVLLENQEMTVFGPASVPAVQSVPHAEPVSARMARLETSASARIVPAGEQVTVTAVLRNPAPAAGQAARGASSLLRPRPLQAAPLAGVTLDVTVPDGWSAQPSTPVSFARVAPGQAATAVWRLTAPAQPAVSAGQFPAVSARCADASGQAGSEPVLLDAVPLLISVPLALAQAVSNVGIGPDGSGQADFDASNDGYSATALAAAGLAPGAAVSSGGVQYVMPDVPALQPDNVIAAGQTITGASQPGARLLGFLGAATSSDATGQVLITYTDGSSQTAAVSFTDWQFPAGAGNTAVATMPYQVGFQGVIQDTPVSIFATTPIALKPGKTVQYVTLPAVTARSAEGAIHVFSIGTDKGPFG